MRKILFAILILTSLPSYSQYGKATRICHKGVKAFNKGNFTKALSFFTLSIKVQPTKDNYFYMAKTQEQLGNHCSYCEYMNKSIQYGKTEAEELYNKNCTYKDTLKTIYLKEKNVTYSYMSIVETCLKKESKKYCLKYDNSDFSNIFKIVSTANYTIEEEDYLSSDFDIGKVPPENFVFIKCEKMPSYPGGDEARMKFIVENIIYPVDAKENNIQGTVYVTFIVESDGTLTDVKVLRGIGGGCDEESVRVVKLMPKWNPGKLSGEAVRVQFNLPIKYTLN